MKAVKAHANGFTLLELLIALGLMAVLSITTTQVLKKSTKQTSKITSGIDELNRLRSVFNMVENDVAKAFNYRDLNSFLFIEAQNERVARYGKREKDWVDKFNKEKKVNPPKTVSSLSESERASMIKEIGKKPQPPQPKKEKIYTHFVGDKEKVYFTSSSGVRFRKEDQVSDLIEVGYFFRSCKSLRYKSIDSKCLWRSLSYNLDEDVTQANPQSEIVILEYVEEFEFKYLSFIPNEKPDWTESWDSRNLSDQRSGGKFPAAVSLEVKVKVPRNKKEAQKGGGQVLSLYGVFPIRFANNDPFKDLKKKKTPQPATGRGNNLGL